MTSCNLVQNRATSCSNTHRAFPKLYSSWVRRGSSPKKQTRAFRYDFLRLRRASPSVGLLRESSISRPWHCDAAVLQLGLAGEERRIAIANTRGMVSTSFRVRDRCLPRDAFRSGSSLLGISVDSTTLVRLHNLQTQNTLNYKPPPFRLNSVEILKSGKPVLLLALGLP